MPARANLDPRNTPLTTEVCEGQITVTDPTHPLFGRTLALVGLATLSSRVRHCQVALESGQVVYVPVASTDRCVIPRPEPTLLTAEAVARLLAVFDAIPVAQRGSHVNSEQPTRLGSPQRGRASQDRRSRRADSHTGGGA